MLGTIDLSWASIDAQCAAMRYARTGGGEIDPPHLGRRWDGATFDERKQRRPVDTGTAPPVPRAWLFVIGKVGMELSQDLSHPPGLIDGYVIVGITVQDVDAKLSEVMRQEPGYRWARSPVA